jgi:hypothetical protein
MKNNDEWWSKTLRSWAPLLPTTLCEAVALVLLGVAVGMTLTRCA